jgi:hypothetical protein
VRGTGWPGAGAGRPRLRRSKSDEHIGFRVTAELAKLVDTAATRSGMKRSAWVIRAIEDALAREAAPGCQIQQQRAGRGPGRGA